MALSSDTLRQALDDTAEFARETILERGQLTPMYVIRLGALVLPIEAPFKSQADKKNIHDLVRTIVAAFDPDYVAFACESWMALSATPDIRASESPNRQEVVFISIASALEEDMRIYKIVRRADQTVDRLEEMELEGIQMADQGLNVYPKTTIDATMRQQIEDALAKALGEEAIEELRAHRRPPSDQVN